MNFSPLSAVDANTAMETLIRILSEARRRRYSLVFGEVASLLHDVLVRGKFLRRIAQRLEDRDGATHRDSHLLELCAEVINHLRDQQTEEWEKRPMATRMLLTRHMTEIRDVLQEARQEFQGQDSLAAQYYVVYFHKFLYGMEDSMDVIIHRIFTVFQEHPAASFSPEFFGTGALRRQVQEISRKEGEMYPIYSTAEEISACYEGLALQIFRDSLEQSCVVCSDTLTEESDITIHDAHIAQCSHLMCGPCGEVVLMGSLSHLMELQLDGETMMELQLDDDTVELPVTGKQKRCPACRHQVLEWTTRRLHKALHLRHMRSEAKMYQHEDELQDFLTAFNDSITYSKPFAHWILNYFLTTRYPQLSSDPSSIPSPQRLNFEIDLAISIKTLLKTPNTRTESYGSILSRNIIDIKPPVKLFLHYLIAKLKKQEEEAKLKKQEEEEEEASLNLRRVAHVLVTLKKPVWELY